MTLTEPASPDVLFALPAGTKGRRTEDECGCVCATGFCCDNHSGMGCGNVR